MQSLLVFCLIAIKSGGSKSSDSINWGFSWAGSTDPTGGEVGFGCLGVLECLVDIIRALRMGSCLSSDGGVAPASPMPSSPGKRGRKGPRKRQGLSKSREQQLHRIPGRMFLNGASGVASLFSQQGKKGTNQDAMIVWENFGSRADTVFCGVFDGHGPLGHMVARKVRDSLPLKLSSHFEVTFGNDAQRQNSISTAGSMNSDDTGSIVLDEELSFGIGSEERHTEIFPALKELFLKAFKFMDKELKLHPSIDCFCSGTTAVTLIKQGQDLVIGNIGDSRAILGTRDQKGSLIAIQLTVDLKPNLPREAERIRRCKGRVFALQDEPEVARVWLPHHNSPGLAMARAFGDFCLKDYGLISVPEISHRRLTERDEFIVLATDGIWDVLSNKDVVDIIASAPVRSYAARTLVEIAVKSWRIKYPTSKIDDCAAVCLFLNPDSSESSSVLGNRELNGSFNATESANNKQESSITVNLDRSGTVRPSSENHPEEVKRSPKPLMTRPPLPGKPSDGNADLREGYEWSALDGVSRMDTILTLPRFVAEEKQSTSSKTPK